MPATGDPIDGWLEAMWDRGATDLLITANSPPLIRVDGAITPLDPAMERLRTEEADEIVSAVAGMSAEDMGVRGDVDFSFRWRDRCRFRGNAFRQRSSLSLALRLIPFQIPTPEELGLPSVVHNFLSMPSGLVIVTGPTGSGKSTTLASMIDQINQHRPVHVVTIEDPIEYMHRHKTAAVHQREVGTDAGSFPGALKAVLREDPDVVLVGEMRDLESIETTLTIAETGHLVFTTLHTNDTAQAIDRIIDVFPSERRAQIQVQLSATLQGVIYQRLLRRVGGGRVGAFELLVANHAIRNLIREGKSRQIRNIIATSASEGMETFESSLSRLVGNGVVEYDEAVNVSLYPREITVPTPARVGR